MTLSINDRDRAEVLQLLFHLDKVENSDGTYTVADDDADTVREVLEEASIVYVMEY